MTRRTVLTALPLTPALLRSLRADENLVPLFDGKSLEGWSIREGPESAFYVNNGDIVIHEGSNFPTWLCSDKRYENFDFRCEYFIKGWSNSGIYVHAPEHGRNTECGMKINIFHKQDKTPVAESNGAIFPLVAPAKVNVKNEGEWNSLRILVDWPSLQVWSNDAQVQDINVETHADLRYRLRSGYLGIESLSYPLRFRNLRIRELPANDRWETLYSSPADVEKWVIADGKPNVQALGPVLRHDGLGYYSTRQKYFNFDFQTYIRGSQHHNGGIIFRGESTESSQHYEIQLHDVEGAVYPTGSLYGFRRAIYPKIEPGQWYLFQLFVRGKDCVVRINGQNVVEYHDLQRTTPGPIMLQAHAAGRWIEYKEMKVKALPG